jgi:hypothetical protein
MPAWIHFDPYESLTESDSTSRALAIGDANLITLSIRTTSGATSALTFQICNANRENDIVEAMWSTYTSATPSAATTLELPAGYRYARVLRQTSTDTTQSIGSVVIDGNKYVPTR